jgi:hypothetical protein
MLKVGFVTTTTRKALQRFVLEMGEDHKASRKARAEFLMQQTGDLPDTEWQPKLRAFIASLGKGQRKGKSLDPKKVAARGPLFKGYVHYAELSADAAHPTLDALQRYLGRAQESGKPETRRGVVLDWRGWSAGRCEILRRLRRCLARANTKSRLGYAPGSALRNLYLLQCGFRENRRCFGRKSTAGFSSDHRNENGFTDFAISCVAMLPCRNSISAALSGVVYYENR